MRPRSTRWCRAAGLGGVGVEGPDASPARAAGQWAGRKVIGAESLVVKRCMVALLCDSDCEPVLCGLALPSCGRVMDSEGTAVAMCLLAAKGQRRVSGMTIS